MDLTHLRLSAAMLVVVLTASACATNGNATGTASSVAPTASSGSATASLIGNSALGSLIQLPQSNELGISNVIAESHYFAASGRECRRLITGSGQAIARVACSIGGNRWQFSRNLQARVKPVSSTSALAATQSNQLTLVTPLLAPTSTAFALDTELDDTAMTVDLWQELPDEASVANTQTAASVQKEVGPVVQFSVLQDETLWAFAKRTTGNALNWSNIAELNAIQNTKAVRSGTLLNVPEHLVGSGE